MWRSLVAHLHGVQGVEGSNPFTPTNFSFFEKPAIFLAGFLLLGQQRCTASCGDLNPL